ncbi:hypothetical protein TNCV_3324771 [Trichonephila clavipes]|nr:hypothetical protein TNCV_3324771 [Trichonephila clavipes]
MVERDGIKTIFTNINLGYNIPPSSFVADATRGLLATDHVILNHGQVTWTTPELAPPSPNYHTTPAGHGQAKKTTPELAPNSNYHTTPTTRDCASTLTCISRSI